MNPKTRRLPRAKSVHHGSAEGRSHGRLPLNHLYCFNAIAEHGSLKEAAEALGVKQPTVSEQITRLEKQLGEPLFLRSDRLRLTRRGRELFRLTSPMFQIYHRILKAGDDAFAEVKPVVTVAVEGTVSWSMAARYFSALFGEFPYKVRLHYGDPGYVLTSLFSRESDIGLINTCPSVAERRGFECKVLYQPELVGVCNRKWMEERGLSRFPEDFEALPMVHYTPQSLFHQDVDVFLDEHHFKPNVVGELDDIDVMREVIASGSAWGFLPTDALPPEGDAAGNLVRLRTIGGNHTATHLMYPRDNLYEHAQHLVERLSEEVQKGFSDGHSAR